MTPNEYGITHAEALLWYVVASVVATIAFRFGCKDGDPVMLGCGGILWPITGSFALLCLVAWLLGTIAEWVVHIAEEIRNNWKKGD